MGGAGRPKGFKVSELTREKMIKAKMGNKNRFIKDRSLVKIQDERNNPIYKQWRYQVFKRDRHICRISNNNCNGKVVVHHILPWRDYPELRYNINNGITLCQFHHPHKRIDEQRLIPTFRSMVEVK
jgi:5-methylcytosine-specific restriction endonuclease McrA